MELALAGDLCLSSPRAGLQRGADSQAGQVSSTPSPSGPKALPGRHLAFLRASHGDAKRSWGKEPCGAQEHFRPAAAALLAQSGARLSPEMVL